MALRDKLRERVQPFLQEGEQVEQVFLAQAGPNPWLFGAVGALIMTLLVKRRIVAVTNRRILVLTAGKFTGTNPKGVLAELPRQSLLGPLEGKVWMKTQLAGETTYINRRFAKDVQEADAAVQSPPPAATGGGGADS